MKLIVKLLAVSFCLCLVMLHKDNAAFADISSLFSSNKASSNNVITLPSFADIVEKVTPAIVNISTTQKASNKRRSLGLFDDPRDMLRELLEGDKPQDQRRVMSLGSGFIFDPAGYIVTNFHVIDSAEEIHVTLSNSSKVYKATVVGKDTKTDIAVLHIEAKEQLPCIVFGDSDKARVGDWVIAIGNPFGLSETVTIGIISAKARYIDIGHFDDLIQTDAAINMGNSGGPMLNLVGEVIGVNSAIISPMGSGGGNVGVGFAIPSSVVQSVVKQLREKGEIVRGWLGVMIQTMNQSIAEGLGLTEPSGALVSGVEKGSPADKAGIQVGDVILKFNNKPVANMHKLPRMVGEADIGSKVPVEIFRDGKSRVLTVLIEKSRADLTNSANDSKTSGVSGTDQMIMGIGVRDISDEIRRAYDIEPSVTGVVVTQVERNSVGALAGIRQGDVILKVDGKVVSSASGFIDLLKAKKLRGAALLISRNGKTFFVGIELK